MTTRQQHIPVNHHVSITSEFLQPAIPPSKSKPGNRSASVMIDDMNYLSQNVATFPEIRLSAKGQPVGTGVYTVRRTPHFYPRRG